MKKISSYVKYVRSHRLRFILYFFTGLLLIGIVFVGIFQYIVVPYQYQKTLTEISLFQEIVRNETDITKCNSISHDEMRAKCQDNLRSNAAIFFARPKDCSLVQDASL
jgi:hypothetical protein